MARLFTRIGNASLINWGKFVYATFIRAGVKEMPEVNGAPAENLLPKLKSKDSERILPNGYGLAFAKKVHQKALSKSGRPDFVEQAMMDIALKIVRGIVQIKPDTDLRTAEAYVTTAVLNRLRSIWKEEKADGIGNADSLTRSDPDSDGEAIDIDDPSAFEEFNKLLTPAEWKLFLSEAQRIHPRLPEWIDAITQGVAKKELAEQWGVSPNMVTNFENRTVPLLNPLLQKFFADQGLGRLQQKFYHSAKDRAAVA